MSRYSSILQADADRCYVDGCCRRPTDWHHIVHGTKHNKKWSEQNGLMVHLCRKHHEECHHTSAWLDKELKIEAQKTYEETHSRADWMAFVGRNYND